MLSISSNGAGTNQRERNLPETVVLPQCVDTNCRTGEDCEGGECGVTAWDNCGPQLVMGCRDPEDECRAVDGCENPNATCYPAVGGYICSGSDCSW